MQGGNFDLWQGQHVHISIYWSLRKGNPSVVAVCTHISSEADVRSRSSYRACRKSDTDSGCPKHFSERNSTHRLVSSTHFLRPSLVQGLRASARIGRSSFCMSHLTGPCMHVYTVEWWWPDCRSVADSLRQPASTVQWS